MLDNDLDDPDAPICAVCEDPYQPARAALGYTTCTKCGDKQAVAARKNWTVAPLHKSNYQLITDPALLVGVNTKGGIVK